MIRENEVSDFISNEFPEINYELEKSPNPNNVYKIMECFVELTRKFINSGKTTAVNTCFFLAEQMLKEGDKTVKNAIVNVYVYSIGTVIDRSGSAAHKLKEMFSGSLKKEYIRQISASGI